LSKFHVAWTNAAARIRVRAKVDTGTPAAYLHISKASTGFIPAGGVTVFYDMGFVIMLLGGAYVQ
jgi:hypothetical protein